MSDMVSVPADPAFAPGKFLRARQAFHRHKRHVGLAGAVITLAAIIGLVATSHASVAEFRPATCQGSWQHVERATGESDAGQGDYADYAASGDSAHPDISCGDFAGDVPDSVIPKQFFVALDWHVSAMVPAQAPVYNDAPQEEVPLESEIQIPSGSSIDLPAENPVPETVPENPENLPGPEAQPADNPGSESETPTNPEPSPVESSSPVGLLHWLGVRAEAQTNGEQPQSLATISYTLDGVTWKLLATVDATNYDTAKFALNDPDIGKWDDMKKLQVRIDLDPNLDPETRVYLDAMRVEVAYDPIEDLIAPPKIEITDESMSVVQSKENFAPGETPEFIISDPGLTISDVTALVQEDKARVIEDWAGVLEQPTIHQEPQSGNSSESLESNETPSNDQDSSINPIQSVIDSVQEAAQNIVSLLDPAVAEAAETRITDATIVDRDGNPTDITVTIETVEIDGVQKQKVTINQPERSFKPGRYTLRISLETPQVIIVSEQDFTWGVLAVNMDRSIYRPGDRAQFAIGVLDDEGHTLCDASLAMQIRRPSGQVMSFSTASGTITPSGQCNGDSVVGAPDYSFESPVLSESGDYQIVLTAVTDNGTKSITDQFKVAPAVSFDVMRNGPTRIYPVANYPVTMQVTAAHDWSGRIIETVPADFDVQTLDGVSAFTNTWLESGVRRIAWDVAMIAGESTMIGYSFDAPDVSPEFYLVGPLQFFTGTTEVFHENREWQIASDATCAATTSGSWNTGSNWTGCSGAGGVPAAGDNITINSGVTITMNVNSPALGTITVNGTLNTSDGTSRTLTGTTLSIGSTGTLTANASTITLSGTTGTPLTLTAGGTFNAGTSTVTLTGNNAAGNTTIPSNISYYNLTINNSAETFVLNGATTISAAGTLTITNGTLDTTASNYTLNAGKISLATSGSTRVLTANASTINLTATSGLLFSRSASAVFNAGTSTVALTGNGDATFNSGTATTFYNVTSSGTGTKTLGLALTLSAAGTLSITNGTFSTGASNLALSVGHIDVQAGGTLTLNTSTMSLTATDGDPVLSTAGTFSNTAFTVTYTGINASGDTIIASGIPYYNLTLNGSGEVYVLEGSTTVNAAGTLTVTAGTLNTTASNYALSFGKISTANSATAILTLNGSTVSATATSGTVFSKGSGSVFNAGTSTVDFTGNGDITLTGAATVSFYNLKISGTGTKSMAIATTVTNVLTITAGTMTTTVSNYGLTVGNLDLQSSGTLTLNGATLTLNGTDGDPVDTIAGTLNIGTSTITYTGNNASGNTIISKDISYYNLTINNSTETYELEGDTTASSLGTVTITAGTLTTTASNYTLSAGKISMASSSAAILTLNASTLNLTATSGFLFTKGANGVFNAGTSTVALVGNGDASVTTTVAVTFYNLTIASTGTKSLAVATVISNTVSITNGTLTTVTNLALTAGQIQIGASGTLLANSAAITVNGNTSTPLSNAGTFNAGTSTVYYTGNNTSGNTTIDMHVPYYNLTLNNVSETYVLEGDTVVDPAGTLTIVAGTFDTTASNYALSAGRISLQNAASVVANFNASVITLTATSGILFSRGGLSATFNSGTSTVILAGNGDATINNGTVAFYNLTLSSTGTKIIATNFSVTNNLVITNGTFNTLNGAISVSLPVGTIDVQSGGTLTLNASVVTISGTNGNPFNAAGTVNVGTSTIVYTGNNASGDTIIHNGVTYYNLTINNSAETYDLEGATTVDTNGTLTISNGTLDTTTNNYQLTAGKITLANVSTAVLTLNGSVVYVTSTGSAVTKPASAVMNPGTSQLWLNGAGNTNISGNFYDLYIAGSGVKNTGASGATVNHDLIVTSGGIWNGTSSTITGSGTNTVHVLSGGILQIGASSFAAVLISFENRDMQAGSTVEYMGGNQTIDSTITYASLKLTNAGTKSLNGTTTVTETVTINAGATLTTTASNYGLNAGSISIDGTSTLTANASTISISDNWTNSGTFTAGTSTVVFNTADTSVVEGSTSFYKLTLTHTAAKEVQFSVAGAYVYTVSNLFTVSGSSGNRIRLRSTSPGVQFKFKPTGTATVGYADVQDGGCEVGAITMSPTNSISSGNNDSCWGLNVTQTLSFSISDNSIGFGTLSSSGPRYCTGDTNGSSSEVEAHTISVSTNAASGYTLYVRGPTLTSGGNTITAIGGSNTASSAGSEQFGLRMTATGGSGAVASPYDGSGFAYDATGSTMSPVASAASGDGVITTYSARYIANISAATESGNYGTNLTYIVTANF